jgi:predicted dinucleotide-binding enzyme
MQVVTIGRGNVGGGLGKIWERRAGHEVTLIGRGGGDVSNADAVLMALPGAAVAEAFETVSGWDGKTVIDATNLINPKPA